MKESLVVKILMLFIFFIELAYSLDFSVLVGKYYMLAIVGLMISIIISSLAYMVGTFLKIPTTVAFAKEEITNLLFTVVIIIFLTGGLAAYQEFSANLAKQTFFSDSATPIKSGECAEAKKVYSKQNRPENALFKQVDWFLGCLPIIEDRNQLEEMKKLNINGSMSFNEVIREVGKYQEDYGIMFSHISDMYIGILAFEMLLGPLSTMGFSIYLPEAIVSGTDIGLSPLAGLNLISESLILLANIVSFGMVNIIVQKTILKFIYVSMLDFVLPLAIAFRCLPFFRRTGSTLIALVVAAYFIYPITLWINEQIYFNALFENNKPLLLNWANYDTLIGVCPPKKEGETMEEYYQRVKETAKKIEEQIKQAKIEEEKIYSQTDVRYPTSQQQTITKRFLGETKNNIFNIFGYLIGEPRGSIKVQGLEFLQYLVGMFTTPFRTEYFFEIILDQYIVIGQWLVLSLIFLVNSILITFIMFKNIAEAMGGDLKLFGIGRLL
ncbi:MAG: hypothetical protein QXH71_00330 [Candidatus Anstonellaceae archaeon]